MLIWNVYIHNINTKQIETYNVFEHYRFLEDIKKSVKQKKEYFKEQLLKDLRYYFWSKSEWEVLITAWCGGNENSVKKIDVYNQIYPNFDIFAEYIWKHKKELLEEEN